MSDTEFAVVGRMEGLWPHQLGKFEMHRERKGGDVKHTDPPKKNRLLVGGSDWAARALARIDEARFANYNRELDALKKRKRKKEAMTRMVEGPHDPWHPCRHGPMRELILTANRKFFDSDLDGFLGGTSLEERFETLAMDWLRDTFGEDLVHARADLDETTYHIHAVILPMKTENGRTVLQPSKLDVIRYYELFQDEIGEVFAPLGLVRGAQDAKLRREARAKGEKPAPRRRHISPRVQRQREESRRIKEKVEFDAAVAEQQRKAAEAEAAIKAERAALEAAKAEQRRKTAETEEALRAERARLAEQADEQDAVLAGAEALGAGLIDPAQDEVMLAPAKPDDPAAAQFIARINKSPKGWRRFAAALTPGWQRMRKSATQAAEAELAKDRARVSHDRVEIEGVWAKLAAMTWHVLPQGSAAQTAREQVAWVLARWRITKDREPRRGELGQRDD